MSVSYYNCTATEKGRTILEEKHKVDSSVEKTGAGAVHKVKVSKISISTVTQEKSRNMPPWDELLLEFKDKLHSHSAAKSTTQIQPKEKNATG